MEEPPEVSTPASIVPVPPNLLVMVVNELSAGDLAQPNVAPALASLRRSGVMFPEFTNYAGSSAPRSALLTGRYGRRTGFGGSEPDASTWELPLEELTLPEALANDAAHPWSTAAVGSWHLASARSPHGFDHPNLQGFDHFSGPFGELTTSTTPTATPAGYLGFEKVTNGRARWVGRYAITDLAEDAGTQLSTLDPPWLLYVASPALRGPLVRPPGSDLTHDPRTATLAAVDRVVQRVMNRTETDGPTIVVVMGTAPHLDDPRAALVVTGPGIAPGTCDALVHAVDVLPTLMELVGIEGTWAGDLDGRSFAHLLRDPQATPPRTTVFTESFAPVGLPPYLAGPYERDDVAVHDHHRRLSRTTGVWRFDERADAPRSATAPRASRSAMRHALDATLRRR